MLWGKPWSDDSGGEGYPGQSRYVWYMDGDKHLLDEAEPWERTCPQYHAQSPFFVSLWNELDDYSEGRIGVLGEISSAHLAYLRAMKAEHTAWLNYWEAKLMPDLPTRK